MVATKRMAEMPLGKRKAELPPGTGALLGKDIRCNSYLAYNDACSSVILEKELLEAKNCMLHRRERYITDPPNHEKGIDGEERVRLFEDYLENGFRWRRHMFQRAFHDKALMVLAPLILGEDWDVVGPALVKQRKWPMERNSRMLLGRAPRRFGKSVAVSMTAAAMLLTVPYITQAIFSTSQRVSIYLGEKIRDDITDAGHGDRIIRFGQERMDIRGPPGSPEDDIRTVFYYPANAKICIFSFIVIIIYTHTPLSHSPPAPSMERGTYIYLLVLTCLSFFSVSGKYDRSLSFFGI